MHCQALDRIQNMVLYKMPHSVNPWISRISIALNVILLVILAGIFLTKPSPTPSTSEQYSFLSRRIFAKNQNDFLINFTSLRNNLQSFIAKQPKSDSIGFYFEYLPSGASIGINEKANFVLASLLKVPLVMATYKEIESGQMNKDQMLTINEEDLDTAFGDLWKKGVGYQLTVKQTIYYALKYSDNTAKNMLFDAIKEQELENVFDALDIPKELEEKVPVVTPKNYTSVLRNLYLSTYLENEHSQTILKLLAETPFDDKIAAGVPQDVPVAHKIGVYIVNPQDQNNSIYTDCGIVYVLKRPYSLCIMMKSSNQEAQKVMKELSSRVYQFVIQAKSF